MDIKIFGKYFGFVNFAKVDILHQVLPDPPFYDVPDKSLS